MSLKKSLITVVREIFLILYRDLFTLPALLMLTAAHSLILNMERASVGVLRYVRQ
ncbi:MAG: hypothetical protein LBB62_09115 [Proteiniphilum sp.]|jgi:hypothetical protein|nr:hypothetical protein [Proteiniphilum sp.]